MPAQLGDLEMAGQKKKQTSFDITNYAPAQKGLQQTASPLAELPQSTQEVPGDVDRARRMQAQFDQPVTKGIPPGGIASGLAGFDAPGQGASLPKRNTFDITNTPAAQRQGGILADLPTASAASRVSEAPAATGDIAGTVAAISQPYALTGIGADRKGGEIVGRTGANGVPEFTNEAATPGAFASARAMPAGGMGGAPLKTPGVSNLADDVPLEKRGSINNIGNGIGGGLSVGEDGDAQMALGRFERANQIRAEMNANRPREVGDNGGRATVVRDSSRAPSIAEMVNERRDARQAETSLKLQQAQQGIAAGLQQATTEQLRQKQLGQQIRGQEHDFQREQALTGILVGLDAPNLQADDRARLERDYLMRSDPKTYLESQAKAGVGQVDLEKKQLERDLLRLKLEQSGSGDGIKLTEQQSKDLGYYTRGNEANALLARQGDALTARAAGERGQLRGFADTAVRGTPWIGDSALANSLVSTERQQAEQSGREVLAAILRKDTGAAITQQEMEIYGRMYLPQPGDSGEVLNQKAEARTRALSSIRSGLGTAERKAAPLLDGQRTTSAGPVRVSSDHDYDTLPSGALFIAPDGSTRRKP